jgi:predicted extracellular nuclease
MRPDLKVVFYNVENYYDYQNDPTVNDEEFLPEGSRKWNKYKFEAKASALFKVFAAMGEFDFPDIIGMAEVENAQALNYLVQQTPMKKYPVKYIHNDSPDPRGIDACVLYRSDKLKLLRSDFIKIFQKNKQVLQTREIAYACFQTKGKDILHVFVNHWPSRRGGEMDTQQKRILVANSLRQKIDSIFRIDPKAKIIIMGDFNDDPFNASITRNLKAIPPNNSISLTGIYNLSGDFVKRYGTGTLKYRGNWSVFDQIIVSGSLLGKTGIKTTSSSAGVYNNRFLLTEDKGHMGYMPWRTYNGLRYSGGFSDHLPVYVNLYY